MNGPAETDRRAALDELVLSLHAMERMIRETHDAGVRVTSAFSTAALLEGLPPLAGRHFISEMARVNLHISDALNHSGDGHRMLRRLATSMGYDVTAYGDGSTSPDEQSGTYRAVRQVA